MKQTKLGTCISLYEDVFTVEKASNFLKKLEKETESDWSELSWNGSSVGSGQATSHRTSLSCSLIPIMKPYPETELSQFFTKTIREPIEEVSEDYRNEFLIPNAIHEAYSVLKYMEQSEYKPHHDHGPDNRRVYSMVSFLSTPEEGGQLEFPLFDVTVEAICGRVVMFPSNFPYLHVAHPVTKGVKYSLVTWYQG
jgi:hypothetical protein